MVALLLALCAPGILAASASAQPRTKPTTPTCSRFSTRKVSALLGVGTMYLDSSLGRGTSCFYYGVPRSKANALASKTVPYNQIKYVASLQIAVETTKKVLFDVQEGALRDTAAVQGLAFEAVARRLRTGSEEFFYSGVISGSGMMRCSSQILYDNWTGPPSCDGQPPLKKVGVLAWIGPSAGTGRMVMVAAATQAPSPLSISRVLELARESVTGQLY